MDRRPAGISVRLAINEGVMRPDKKNPTTYPPRTPSRTSVTFADRNGMTVK